MSFTNLHVDGLQHIFAGNISNLVQLMVNPSTSVSSLVGLLNSNRDVAFLGVILM